MSKRREQELLKMLVDYMHDGKINEASNMLDEDKQHRLVKYTDEVCML